MATQPPRSQTREEQRRLSIRTLAIASVASAAAAVVTSQFWIHGTWVTAAVTPVIVAVVSELLHRPTEAVARKMTTERAVVLPPLERDEEPGPEPIPDQVKVYGGGRSRRKKFAIGLVAATAALGFVIGALVLTVPELVTGRPIGRGDGGTTIFGAKENKKKDEPATTQQQTAPTQPQQTQTTPTPTQTQTQPQQQTQTQPATPRTTPTQPAPQRQPGAAAPP
jgi:hypothetical protein